MSVPVSRMMTKTAGTVQTTQKQSIIPTVPTEEPLFLFLILTLSAMGCKNKSWSQNQQCENQDCLELVALIFNFRVAATMRTKQDSKHLNH